MSTKVLIVDDHPIVREGISRLVERESDMHVCGEAEDVHDALDAIEEHSPDVVLVDLSLKESDGMDLVQDIKLRFPDIRVLVLSMHDEKYYADRALRVGARGYLMKDEAPKKVVKAIRRIMSGEIYVSEAFAMSQIKRLTGQEKRSGMDSLIDKLSDREIQVLRMYGEGITNRQIAERLSLSPKTIESHIERIKMKLEIRSGRELLLMAYEFNRRSQGGQIPSAV